MLLLLACAPPPELPVHHLVFGGDLIAGKRLNAVVIDPVARAAMLEAIEPQLKAADLALVNLEGVVSLGGDFLDKGEPRPILYRNRPELIDALAAGGVDVLAMANNHSGDYGFDALRETLDRARLAGLDYVGAGHDAADARRPVYRVVGDTVVAIICADITNTAAYAATTEHPGTFVLAPKHAAAELAPIVAEARKHAQVVLLTTHWGPNGATEPTEEIRAAGRALIGIGFDAILGHSAHVLQGVELVDGKPILYDAGNFLAGHRGSGDQADGLLYDLSFTRAGVTAVKALPLAMVAGRAAWGTPATLTTWTTRTQALGTKPEGDTIRCSPGAVEGPEGTPPPPEREVPTSVRLAPRTDVLTSLPTGATPADVAWANGVRLIGYHLLATELPTPKAGQVIDLYFTADGPVARDLTITVQGRGERVDQDPHYPADWALPGDEWPPGAVIHDRTLLRLTGKPEGTITFVLSLAGSEIISSSLPQDRGVVLGQAVYRKGAPRIFKLLADELSLRTTP